MLNKYLLSYWFDEYSQSLRCANRDARRSLHQQRVQSRWPTAMIEIAVLGIK